MKLYFLLFITTACFAMQEVIKGNLTLKLKTPVYAGSFYQYKKAMSTLEISESEPMIAVMVTDQNDQDNQTNWTKHIHSALGDLFPKYLPLCLLSKKEGDIIRLTVYNKVVELCCKQQRNKINGNYEQVFDHLMKDFFQNPNYNLLDVELLKEKGIIAYNEIDDSVQHGPNGFKFN